MKNKSSIISLYRDDALSVYKNKSGTQLERIKKRLQKTFKDFGLEMVAESNLSDTQLERIKQKRH